MDSKIKHARSLTLVSSGMEQHLSVL